MELFLGLDAADPSWLPLIDSQIGLLRKIKEEIGQDETCPPTELALRFLKKDLHSVKVVILGQDPYPQKGAATGRAFEVGGLLSFSNPFRQISLKNILRLIYQSYTGEEIGWNELKAKIGDGSFAVLPPDRLFASWEEQGVLLLNSSFTCKIGEPMSHAALWEPFTNSLLSYISKTKPDIRWFLWGKNAEKTAAGVTGKRYVSRHPMLCGGKAADDFLKNPCFAETKDIIDWRGK